MVLSQNEIEEIEELEKSFMELRIDIDCIICHDPVSIPVIPLLNCQCRYTVCLRCYRNYTELNIWCNKRTYSKRCIYCQELIFPRNLNAKSAYRINFRMINIIDQNPSLYGFDHGISCSSCPAIVSSQIDLLHHIRGNSTNIEPCSQSFISCKYREEGCYLIFKRCDIQEHENVCTERPQCYLCIQQYNNSHICEYVSCLRCGIIHLKNKSCSYKQTISLYQFKEDEDSDDF